MAQVGTAKLDINGAVYEVPVFNYGDMDYPVIRSGVLHNTYVKGAAPFYPIDEEPTHNEVRVYHPTHGVMGLHDDATVIEIIEDWESFDNQFVLSSGQTGAWHKSGTATAITRWVAGHGDGKGISIEDGGQASIWSNATNNDGLPTYPTPGTRTEILWYCEGQDSPEFWFGTTNEQPPGRYQLEYFWDGNFQLRCFVSGNEQWQARSNNNPVSLSTNTWYKFVVDWGNPSRSNEIYCEVQSVNGDFIAAVWRDDTTHRNGAIGMQGNPHNGRVFFDQKILTDRY